MPQVVAAAVAEAAAAEAATVAVSTTAAEVATAEAARQAAAEAARQAAMETAKQQAIQQGTQQMAQQATQQGLQQTGQQVGAEALQQGLGQAAQPLPPAGPPGGTPFTPPTTPPPPAQPLPPAAPPANPPIPPGGPEAGGQMARYQTMDPTKLKGLDAAKFDAINGTTLPENAFPGNFIDKVGAEVAKDVGTTAAEKTLTSKIGQGFTDAMKWMGKNRMETGLGLMSAGQYLNQPETPEKKKYKNTVDMSGFQPSVPVQQPFQRSYEWKGYAVGGQVERMAAQNAVGANTGYPMANLQTPMYANPAIQRPEATNVVAPSVDAGVGSYSGEPRFAGGGLSEEERREYGLTTSKERAARGLTQSYLDLEKQRAQELEKAKSIGDKFDEGIIPRSRTQQLTSPYSAAMTEYARLAKKSKVPVAEMPKTNLGDIDNYMDTPIDAAQGGIMHGAQQYAKGGETQYGRPVRAADFATNARNSENYFRAEAAGGRNPNYARAKAPEVSLPAYSAPVQQATYTPMSYQDNSSYQMPQLQSQQRADMNGFYDYMDQQLGNYGNYGYASGGIMHGLGGYSDGGRLLKGPGDGVSDSIPAVIGDKQPARLADGEFVVPARIVSELGNGSTEAGARKLYAMMERVQASRKKSIGKKKVAVNSKSDKHLPA